MHINIVLQVNMFITAVCFLCDCFCSMLFGYKREDEKHLEEASRMSTTKQK